MLTHLLACEHKTAYSSEEEARANIVRADEPKPPEEPQPQPQPQPTQETVNLQAFFYLILSHEMTAYFNVSKLAAKLRQC